MAAATVLHVGRDFAYRIPVMEHGGLAVVRSEYSVESVQKALARYKAFSLITFHNEDCSNSDIVVSTTRVLSPAPLVLFESSIVRSDERMFDLVIDPYTSPTVWLNSLRQAIEEGRKLRQASEQLRQDSLNVRLESRRLQAAASACLRKNRIDLDALWRGK